ncbi:site-2 protease family protein [Candidatus Riflebacteria bacterium]
MDIVSVLEWLKWFVIMVPAAMFALGSIATIHEFGHYIISVLCGVKVHEFALGVGKPFWIKKMGETFFSLRPIPIAAFVKPAGMEKEDDLDYLRISKIKKKIDPQKPILELQDNFPEEITSGNIFLNGEKFSIHEETTITNLLKEINERSKEKELGIYASFNPAWSLVSLEATNENIQEVNFQATEEFAGEAESNLMRVLGFISTEEDWELLKGKRFEDKNFFQKQAILFAGSFGNFILAFMFLFLIFIAKGKPLQYLQIEKVFEKSAAAAAKLKSKDVITHIDGIKIRDKNQGIELIEKYPGKTVKFTIIRPEEKGKGDKKEIIQNTKIIMVIPNAIKLPNGNSVGKIGVSLFPRTYGYAPVDGIFEAVSLAAESTILWIKRTIIGLLNLFATRSSAGISGPVAIINMIGVTAQSSFFNLLSLVAILSVNIGILNLLPIPALDGGRMLFLGVETLVILTGSLLGRNWKIDPKYEQNITMLGILFLLGLMLLATIGDIKEIIGKYFSL